MAGWSGRGVLKMQDKLEVCIKDWAELADEYKELELRHKEYREGKELLLFF